MTEKLTKCVVCGQDTFTPFESAFEHFHLYRRGQWQWLKGNMRMFGRVSGFLSTCYLAFPALNTLRFWRHRKSRLVLAPDETEGEANGL